MSHAAFLNTIREHPDADLPRLVFADWLDEAGDPARAAAVSDWLTKTNDLYNRFAIARLDVGTPAGEAAARHWFTITRTVDGDGVMCAGRRAVVLGIEARFAGDLADARGVSLDRADAVPLGTPCLRCGRAECLTPAPTRLAGVLPRARPA
jgi:uncharacterized protein (TIGR02996 family)